MSVRALRSARQALCRYASTQAATVENPWSKTLWLPKTDFALWTDPSTSEAPYRSKTCDDLYKWQWENAKGPLFVLHDGPPYANGDLHMGHALNKVLKDIIIRYQMSTGRKVHYIPGWDCHGLPIENKALQELKGDSRTIPRESIVTAARAMAEREVASQREQFKQLGIMADWSHNSTYRTLDHPYEMRQLRVFQKMVQNGLIYRHYRPVHYSPSSRSALAEAELVYQDNHVSHSVYVTFSLSHEGQSSQLKSLLAREPQTHLLVWTTTPWTLTANQGIAVHSDILYTALRRTGDVPGVFIVAKELVETLSETMGPTEHIEDIPGSELIGASYTPIFSSLSGNAEAKKIIFAPHVTAMSGTGLVHCAPAHGAEDYNAFRDLGLLASADSIICHVNADGCFTPDVADVVGSTAAPHIVGKEILTEGSRAIVDLLKQMDALVKIKRIKHRYPYDWKTSKPIIVTATSQWFANLDGLKEDAVSALRDVQFIPPPSRNRLEAFIKSRSEWCISRQRPWGVPILSLHHIASDRAVLDSQTLDYILAILQEKGVAHWWNGPVEDFVPPALHKEGEVVSEAWVKGTDTMDVWFDSGSSWTMLEGLEGQNDRHFLADVCLEGSDQHRGWFQSQLLTSVASTSAGETPSSPYGALLTHGMVLDQHGKKMSKSIGNIVSPMMIINGGQNKKKEPAYGADTLRLWAATVEFARDMMIGPTVLAQAATSIRQIRNSVRFILGNIGDRETRASFVPVERKDLGLVERYVMHELYKLERVAQEGYASYNFTKVVTALTSFTNITLSSLYFDICKDTLYADSLTSHERRATVTVLEHILPTLTSILAPILPHLAEEVYHQNNHGADVPSFFRTPWKPLTAEWEDPQAETDMNGLLRVRSVVLSLLEKARAEKLIKSSLEAEVDLILPSDETDGTAFLDLLRREESLLKTLFIVSDAGVIDEGSMGVSSPTWLFADSVGIPGCEAEVGIRVRPASLHKCPRCWTFTRPTEDELCPRCTHWAGVN